MNSQVEKIIELDERGESVETLYRSLTETPQTDDRWEGTRNYEATMAYTADTLIAEADAVRNELTGEDYWKRMHDAQDEHKEPIDGKPGHREATVDQGFAYEHKDGHAQIWLDFQGFEGNLMTGSLDLYPADPVWESESNLVDDLVDRARTIVEANETAYLEPIDPRTNGGGIANIRVPTDTDYDELEHTWESINTITEQLNPNTE